MAFTLEATLVVPLSMSLLIGLTGLTLPMLGEVDAAARNAAKAQVERLTLAYLYHLNDSGNILQTSPQHLVEWIELVHEAKRTLIHDEG